MRIVIRRDKEGTLEGVGWDGGDGGCAQEASGRGSNVEDGGI